MKQALGTLALMSLFAFVGLTGPSGVQEASAATDIAVTYFSSSTSRVVVSSGLASGLGATRIDHWAYGSTGTAGLIAPGRISLQWQNLDDADEIYCSPDPKVSTNTASNLIGFKYAAGVFASEGLTPKGAYYCKAADAAGAAGVIIVQKQVGRN